MYYSILSHNTCKSIFPGFFDQRQMDKFAEESLTMSRFKHGHVMGLIGVCIDAGSAPYIVMPYMANGSLLSYLKRERRNLILTEDTDGDEARYSMYKEEHFEFEIFVFTL